MKNSFLRLVSVALLSAVTGMVFAGTNPKFQNSAGSNQRSVKTGGDAKGTTGPVMKAGRGKYPIIGNGKTRSRVFKGEGGEFFLRAEIPNAIRTIGGKEFSVGGCVQVPFTVVPDEECKDEKDGDKICKDVYPRWNRGTGCVEVPQKEYEAMILRGNYDRSGVAVLGESFGDLCCGIVKKEIDMTLTHEAVHVAFDREYLELDGDDADVKAQYHFVSEMMAYMIGEGKSPEEAARCAVKSAPDELKEKIKVLSDAFIKRQFQFRSPEDIVKGKGNVQGDVQSVGAQMPDLTKLINLLKQAIEEYRKILAAGRKMSDNESGVHNNLMGEIYKEMYALVGEVKKRNFTEEEQKQFDQLCKEKVLPLFDQGIALQQQIEAKGYGHFVDRFRQMPFGSKEDAAAKTKVKSRVRFIPTTNGDKVKGSE